MTGGRLGVGIIGCANIARKYAIRALQALPAVGEIVIASRDPLKSQAFSEEFGIGTRDSYAALIADPIVDAVYVPLPVGLHEEWVVRAASSKKHVLCEKSLAPSFASAKRMVDVCRANGVLLFEDFMCDYHPQHQAVLSLIREGAIGDPLMFKGYFGFSGLDRGNVRYQKDLGGGSLNDAGAYPVFMARKMLGSEPISVTCALNRDPSFGVDTRGSAYLEFPSAKAALVGFGFANFYQNNYSIWGSGGKISVDRAYSIQPAMKPSVVVEAQESGGGGRRTVDVPPANHFELLFSDFCETVLSDDRVKKEATYGQLLSQARALEAMRISSNRGRAVRLDVPSESGTRAAVRGI